METRFVPSDLNDVSSLRCTWLSGKKELDCLDAATNVEIQNATHAYRLAPGRIAIVLITLPLRIPLIIFLRSIETLLKCFDLKENALSLGFAACDLETPINQALWQIYWGKRLLVPSFNCYAKRVRYMTRYQEIRRKDIKNPLIKAHLIKSYPSIRFNLGQEGKCSGSVTWMVYLFLKAVIDRRPIVDRCNRYSDFMSLLASQFKEGQPLQAVLLQSLIGASTPLLHLKWRDFAFDQATLESEQEYEKRLEELPFGVYHVRVIGVHSVFFLKTPNELLAFDPNVGLIELTSIQEIKVILQSAIDKMQKPRIVFSQQFLKLADCL